MSSPGDSDTIDWDEAVVSQFLEELPAYRFPAKLSLSLLAILFFEYLITFDREVGYAWGRKLTWAKAVFFVNRYLIMLQYLASAGSYFLPPSSFRRVLIVIVTSWFWLMLSDSCLLFTRTGEACEIVLFIAWAAFSGLRVLAISEGSKIIASVVILLALVPAAISTTLAALTDVSVVNFGPPGLDFLACSVEYNLDNVYVLGSFGLAKHIPLLVSEAIVIAVTLLKTWYYWRRKLEQGVLAVHESYAQLILREGVTYFAAMLLLNVAQAISDYFGSSQPDFAAACLYFDLMVPILITRFYLNLGDLQTLQRAERESLPPPSRWKPLPRLPQEESPPPYLDEGRVNYTQEVIRYNGRLRGKERPEMA